MYSLNNAPNFRGFNLYFHLFHPLGNIFDFHILGWRWFGALSLQLSGAYLLLSIAPSGRLASFRKIELAIVGAFFGLTFYNFALIFTPAYNHFTSAACMLLIGALVRFIYSPRTWGPVLVASFAILLLFTCRLSSPFVMVPPLILTAYYIKQIRMSVYTTILLSFVWIAALYLWKEAEFTWMLAILPILARSSHDQILFSLASSLLTVIVTMLSILGLRILIDLIFKIRNDIIFFISCLFLAVASIAVGKGELFRNEILLGIVYANLLNLAWRARDRRVRLIVLSVCYLSIGLHLGTNESVIMQAVKSSALLLFILPWVLNDKLAALGLVAVLPIAFWQVIQIDSNYYRENLSEKTVELMIPRSPLNGIYITESNHNILVNLNGILEAEQVYANRTPIFVYADSPGLIAALGGDALGTPWYVTGYKNVDEYNCKYFAAAFSETNKVFFIETFEMSDEMKRCALQDTQPLKEMTPIGRMPDTRSSRGLLDLKWAYIFKKSAQ